MAAARHSLRPRWLALRTRAIATRRSSGFFALAALALAACQSSDVSRSLGARCDVTSDCDQKCLAPGADWPGGFCTTACMSDEECGDRATCIAEDGGICAFSCSGSDADCAFLGDGYKCQLVVRQEDGSMGGVCRGG